MRAFGEQRQGAGEVGKTTLSTAKGPNVLEPKGCKRLVRMQKTGKPSRRKGLVAIYIYIIFLKTYTAATEWKGIGEFCKGRHFCRLSLRDGAGARKSSPSTIIFRKE